MYAALLPLPLPSLPLKPWTGLDPPEGDEASDNVETEADCVVDADVHDSETDAVGSVVIRGDMTCSRDLDTSVCLFIVDFFLIGSFVIVDGEAGGKVKQNEKT